MPTIPVANYMPRLQRMVTERPLKTVETMTSNDFYGHASMLKQFTGLPRHAPLKVTIEHGYRFNRSNWKTEINSPFPIYLCWTSNRFPVIVRESPKICFALGPLIHYAPPTKEGRLADLRAAYGRNLLFFPSHSTHWVDSVYNIDHICDQLEALKCAFDTIRICLYWRDIQLGLHETYLKRGFIVECAGHMYDHNFYPRLRAIIEPATVTGAMVLGGAIGHCLYLKKPFFYLTVPIRWESKHQEMLQTMDQSVQEWPEHAEMLRLFNGFREDITKEQHEFAATHFGLGQEKSPSKLRRILMLSEEIWLLSQQGDEMQPALKARLLLAKALERHHIADKLPALQYMEQAIRLAPELEPRALDILRSGTQKRVA